MQNRFPPLSDPPRAQARVIRRPVPSLPWFAIGLTLALIALLRAL